MDKLSSEMIQKILSKLPVKSLTQCGSVCHRWRELTHDPFFTKIHTAQSMAAAKPGIMFLDGRRFFFLDRRINASIPTCLPLQLSIPDLKEFNIVSSCNGLLCLFMPLDQEKVALEDSLPLFVCNPFLQKIIKLPPCEYSHVHLPSHGSPIVQYVFYYDFGFCPKTQSYKVFLVLKLYVKSRLHFSEDTFEIYIHTLGDKSWTRIDFQINLSQIRSSGSASNVNGALHWVSKYSADSLTVFDLEHNVFKEMPGPILGTSRDSFSNIVIGHCLSIINIHDHIIDVWIMKDYWVSWEKCLTINFNRVINMSSEFEVIDYRIEDEELLIWDPLFGLHTYNIRENTVRNIYIKEGCDSFVLHFDTLEVM